jgi:hypothetical protein
VVWLQAHAPPATTPLPVTTLQVPGHDWHFSETRPPAYEYVAPHALAAVPARQRPEVSQQPPLQGLVALQPIGEQMPELHAMSAGQSDAVLQGPPGEVSAAATPESVLVTPSACEASVGATPESAPGIAVSAASGVASAEPPSKAPVSPSPGSVASRALPSTG